MIKTKLVISDPGSDAVLQWFRTNISPPPIVSEVTGNTGDRHPKQTRKRVRDRSLERFRIKPFGADLL